MYHPATEHKQRVVILGAGPSGLTAAWHLSQPRYRDTLEVTVYQMGWRAGGQCATGRVGPSMWVNQNGTHYIFGCYHQSLNLLKDAYAELERHGITDFGTADEQLVPRNLFVLKQLFKGSWTEWLLPFPVLSVDARRASRLDGIEHGALLLLHQTLTHLLHPDHLHRLGRSIVDDTADFLGELQTELCQGVEGLAIWPVEKVARGLIAYVEGVIEGKTTPWAVDTMVALARLVRRVLRDLLEPFEDLEVVILRWLILVDLGLTVFIGTLVDKAGTPEGLAGMDRMDFREWLIHHGALHQSVYSSATAVWYDAIAAYEEGDNTRPSAAAGATLVCLLKLILDYQGSVAYQLTNEIGDSLIGPAVAALKLRGVRFAFFHRLWDIVPDDAGRIGRIVLERQADVQGGPFAYDPFVDGYPDGRKVWPDDPKWDALTKVYGPKVPGNWQRLYIPPKGKDGTCNPHTCPLPDPKHVMNGPQATIEPAMDSYFYPRKGPDVVLEAGKDFDVVISALRHTMYPSSAPTLLGESKAWNDAVHKVGGAETQSLRVWFRRTLEGLGWNEEGPVLSSYVLPYATWEDPSPVLQSEHWPSDDQPLALCHLFGPLPFPDALPAMTDSAYLGTQDTAANFDAAVWSRYATGTLWPGATSDLTPLTMSSAAVVAVQVRPNAGPDQRYTMIRPGTAQYRLSAAGTGYPNLVVAGDWTRTELLTGSLEGAVDSGRTAASAALTALLSS